MTEEELAREAASLMKTEDEALDPRLERYAAGELSEAELTELKAEAEANPDIAEALSLLAPLSTTLKTRIASEPASDKPERSNVRTLAFAATTGLALAASLALFMITRPPAARLPEYRVRASVGDAEFRRANNPVENKFRVGPGEYMSILFRPRQTATTPITGVLWVKSNGDYRRSPANTEISEDGSVRWVGTADELSGGARGKTQFLAIVGQEDALPSPDKALNQREAAGWRSYKVEVDITTKKE